MPASGGCLSHDWKTIKLYSLQDQMERASLSVPSNIAEGQERDSDGRFHPLSPNRQRLRRRACAHNFILPPQLGLVDAEKSRAMICPESKEISAMLQGLIRLHQNHAPSSCNSPRFFKSENSNTETLNTITIQCINDYKVRDISLAGFGRKEIEIAEHEMPGLMATRAQIWHRTSRSPASVSWARCT